MSLANVAYLDIFIEGVPVPQGSLRASGRGHLYYSNNATLKPWRSLIVRGVKAALPDGHIPLDTGVEIEATFYFPRPKSATRTQKTTAPDLDKLTRAVGDALTESALYTDDSRITRWVAEKHYADNHPPGVHILAKIIAF
jgi:Holliday junction resolvase RusA-like endonuclease